jgi:hypothetical protein
MSHLVFVETTASGVQAIQEAVRLGHTVTLIRSGKFDWLLEPAHDCALAAVGCRTVRVADT